jgi:signal recognition particle receptor subunit beta
METTDPFWTLTNLIPKSMVDPQFTISVFQSSDTEKTKRALVCSVSIELESIIGPEKETMFDVPGTNGKTIIMLDRIQEVVPSS